MTTKTPRYCLQCDDGTVLVHETKDVHGTILGETYDVPAVTGWHCPKCGEIEFDPNTDDSDRVGDALEAAAKIARARRASELRAGRKQLKLTQEALARAIDTSVYTLRGWEQGRYEVPGSVLCLMRIVSRHPEVAADLVQA